MVHFSKDSFNIIIGCLFIEFFFIVSHCLFLSTSFHLPADVDYVTTLTVKMMMMMTNV